MIGLFMVFMAQLIILLVEIALGYIAFRVISTIVRKINRVRRNRRV